MHQALTGSIGPASFASRASLQQRIASIPHQVTPTEKAMRMMRPVVGPPTRPVRKAVRYVRWRIKRLRRRIAAEADSS